ncbi:hypothetical protein Tco_0762409 [Tanacetum coccineum]
MQPSNTSILSPSNDEEEDSYAKDDVVEKKMTDDDKKDDNDDHTDHALVRSEVSGSLETRNEQIQTPIPLPPRSPRTNLSSDKEFADNAPKMIEELFQSYIQNNAITFHPATISSTVTSSSTDLQHQLYWKIKRSIQDQAEDIYTNHDDHQEDDAPPEGEKRAKRHKSSKRSKSARGSSSKQPTTTSKTYVSERQQQQEWDTRAEESVIDEDKVIPKDETPEMIKEFQNIDKHVLTIFDYERMEATLRDTMSNQFKDVEEYAYHLKQTKNYMENHIVWESRQKYIRGPGPRAQHGNTEEISYILSLYKIHEVLFPKDDLEEKLKG